MENIKILMGESGPLFETEMNKIIPWELFTPLHSSTNKFFKLATRISIVNSNSGKMKSLTIFLVTLNISFLFGAPPTGPETNPDGTRRFSPIANPQAPHLNPFSEPQGPREGPSGNVPGPSFNSIPAPQGPPQPVSGTPQAPQFKSLSPPQGPPQAVNGTPKEPSFNSLPGPSATPQGEPPEPQKIQNLTLAEPQAPSGTKVADPQPPKLAPFSDPKVPQGEPGKPNPVKFEHLTEAQKRIKCGMSLAPNFIAGGCLLGDGTVEC